MNDDGRNYDELIKREEALMALHKLKFHGPTDLFYATMLINEVTEEEYFNYWGGIKNET
jgi:hypothetical protein